MSHEPAHQADKPPAAPPGNAFVIGHPISHSRSPLIHRHWLDQYGLDATYKPHEILPRELKRFFSRIRSGAFIGGNITLPHKEPALALCDQLSREAKIIGAVNTIHVRNAEIHGFNTDVYGFLANLDQNAPGWDDNLASAIVLGAGGAARAVILALIQRRATKIIIVNRTEKKAANLATHFSAHTVNTNIIFAPPGEFNRFAPTANLLVNTTSVGLNGTRHRWIDLSGLDRSALVTDIVYTPLHTPLLKEAAGLGLSVCDGLGMLLHQAVPGFELWFNVRPAVTPRLRRIIQADIHRS